MSSASVPFADRPDCTRRNKANRPCTRPEAPWPDGAPLPDPHSCGLHFTDEERAALGRPAAVRAGAATSFYLTAPLMERRRAVKEATGCPDAYLYEHGLHSVEVELVLALKANADLAGLGSDGRCAHPSRYPNGRCRVCYTSPPSFPPPNPHDTLGVPGALFRSASG